MMTITRRTLNRAGQGLVEFVLIAPILLALFFGLVEFARAWNIRHVVTDAAREGARNLAIDNPLITNDSVMQVIQAAMNASSLDTTSATITLDNGGSIRGNQARVTITYPFDLTLTRALLGWALPNGQLTIGTTFVMRNE
jgi:Flp pilus assembly protein TadG